MPPLTVYRVHFCASFSERMSCSSHLPQSTPEASMTVTNAELHHRPSPGTSAELCRRFPDTYWRELDARAGLSGRVRPDAVRRRPISFRADSRGVRRRRARDHGGLDHPGGGQSGRGQRRGVPRADVHHGHAAPARVGRAEAGSSCRRSPAGELRLQAFAVTEPTTGTDTTQLKTIGVRQGDRYVVNGQKVWISRAEHSDLMLLIARTTPLEEVTEEDRRAVGLPDRPPRRRGATASPSGRCAR